MFESLGEVQAEAATPAEKLRGAETREIVTPYAFRIHDSLLGLPLARPWRRAVAILIDGGLVGLLSLIPAAVLLVAASLSLWAATRKLAIKRSKLLRVLALLGGVIGTLILVASNDTVQSTVEKFVHVIRVAEYRGDVERRDCVEVQCARETLDDLAWLVANAVVDDSDPSTTLDEYLEGLALSPIDREGLRQMYRDHLAAYASTANSEDPADPKSDLGPDEMTKDSSYSLLGWAKGLLQDLGLSLGWAALYFSAFTAVWNGQTPGKRLLHIRVQMLGGGRISWWDAFSRYGGYGAGFATGLLGFLQLGWDANRQAIQDKIAGTVVIYEEGRPTRVKPERSESKHQPSGSERGSIVGPNC